MEAKRTRPAGGRFTEWTNGRAIVATDVLAPSPAKAAEPPRVITAPFPVELPGAVVEPASSPSVPASHEGDGLPGEGRVITAPLPVPVLGAAGGAPSSAAPMADGAPPKRKAAKIKEHPVADKLLESLSSYDRPYLVEEVSQTNGHPAAAYAGLPLLPGAAVVTPPLQPKTRLTDSLVKEIGERKALAVQEVAAREVPTVVTRSVPASDEGAEAEPARVAGVPRHRLRATGGAAAGVALLCMLGVAVLALTRHGSPATTPTAASRRAVEAPVSATPPAPPLPPPSKVEARPGDAPAAAPVEAPGAPGRPSPAQVPRAAEVAAPRRRAPTPRASASAASPPDLPIRPVLRIDP